MKFYLGVPELAHIGQAGVPTFLSVRRAMRLKLTKIPRAAAPWAMDSGGFSIIRDHGGYPDGYELEHIAVVRQLADKAGQLDWAAAPDWMCSSEALQATGLDVATHQRRTVDAFARYRRLAPEVSWLPTLQGQTFGQYLDHVRMYDAAGFDLTSMLVGLGSVHDRQEFAVWVVRLLRERGISLHGFGLKTRAVRMLRPHDGLVSADSMAWSAAARNGDIRLEGCEHDRCASCLRWALRWREDMLGGDSDGRRARRRSANGTQPDLL